MLSLGPKFCKLCQSQIPNSENKALPIYFHCLGWIGLVVEGVQNLMKCLNLIEDHKSGEERIKNEQGLRT